MNPVEIAVWARVYIVSLANRNHEGRVNTPLMAQMEATDGVRRMRTSATTLEEEARVFARREAVDQERLAEFGKRRGT